MPREARALPEILPEPEPILCPLFLSEDLKKIECNIMREDSSISTSFRTKADKEIQRSVFCCRRYGYCELYRMVNHIPIYE